MLGRDSSTANDYYMHVISIRLTVFFCLRMRGTNGDSFPGPNVICKNNRLRSLRPHTMIICHKTIQGAVSIVEASFTIPKRLIGLCLELDAK
jgi:hypothetical protein